ncbi:kinesin light chain-related protein 1, partial [Tanacetum coccineum]
MVCAAIVDTLKLKLRILELRNLIQNVHMCKLHYYLGQLKFDIRCPGLMIDGMTCIMSCGISALEGCWRVSRDSTDNVHPASPIGGPIKIEKNIFVDESLESYGSSNIGKNQVASSSDIEYQEVSVTSDNGSARAFVPEVHLKSDSRFGVCDLHHDSAMVATCDIEGLKWRDDANKENMSRIWELIFFDEVPSFDNVETFADASVETSKFFLLLRYLAEAHVQAMQFDEADTLCKRTLEIHRVHSAPASLEEAADRRLMALICEAKGDYETALEHLVLASMAMIANGQDNEVAAIDLSIGNIYLSLSRFDEAVFSYQKALTVFKASKGDNHPSV